MMGSYNEMYLSDAMRNLGEAFDYAVNYCKLDADEFMNLFVSSEIAEAYGKGNPKYIAGLSGTELVMTVLDKVGYTMEHSNVSIEYERSPEYWCGWVLAYYQWFSKRSFRDINLNVSADAILKMYPTLHEASEEKFVDTINCVIKRNSKTSKLQQQRQKCGLSQRQLSEISGVNLRTLQQYELKSKDINKASVNAVIALADALSCRIDDISENN